MDEAPSRVLWLKDVRRAMLDRHHLALQRFEGRKLREAKATVVRGDTHFCLPMQAASISFCMSQPGLI